MNMKHVLIFEQLEAEVFEKRKNGLLDCSRLLSCVRFSLALSQAEVLAPIR